MAKGTFGPGDPLYEMMRRERERQEVFKRALGPSREVQAIQEALKKPLSELSGLSQSGGFLDAVRTANLHADTIKSLQRATSPAWASSISQAAIGMNRDRPDLLQIERLASAQLETGILATAKALSDNKSLIASAIAASSWKNAVQPLLRDLLPDTSIVRAAASRARMTDMLTLNAAAANFAPSATMMLADEVIRVSDLVDALDGAETLEESVSYLSDLFAAIAFMFEHFGENTLEEIRKIGGIKALELIAVALSIVVAAMTLLQPDVNAEIGALRQQVVVLQSEVADVRHTVKSNDAAYVAGLPRAKLTRAAPIRSAPDARAAVLLRPPVETILAIKGSDKDWRHVVYHDPLTGQLAEGWVFRTAVATLDP